MSSSKQEPNKPSLKSRETLPKSGDGEEGSRAEKRDFHWYGGKVNESVVREIVRLKREHKL